MVTSLAYWSRHASMRNCISTVASEGSKVWAAGVTLPAMTLQTRELVRIAEEEEEEAAARPSALGSRPAEEAPQQQWDCESVLSLRSNLDNHPGTISEQSSRRYKPASGRIKLATKTGKHQQQSLSCDAHVILMR